MSQETVRQAGTTAPASAVVLEVIDGPDRGARVAGSELTIGSAEGNTLRLRDPAVSRFHAALHAVPGGVTVIDHGSTNGIYAGGIRLERARVPLLTDLRLGDSTVRVGTGAPVEIELHQSDQVGELRGRSPAMRRLMAELVRVARTDASVLVTGESGTGKELIARALHDLGSRARAPFVTIDCGALAPALVASELFGHERGAFTGADRQHVGAFESAHGGTVFLDEIGELPPAIQASLLGVLERRRLRRLGGRTEIAVDVRIISATHRDLKAEVNRGGFRLDLFYRLAVCTLVSPPLRDRPDDVPLLVEHFLRDAGWEQPVGALISPAAMDALSKLHFAGNVRELRNLVEAAVALGLPPAFDGPRASPGAAASTTFATDLESPYKVSRAELLDRFEAAYVEALLVRAGGNVSAAARLGQMTRSHLNELIAKHRSS